MSNPAVRHHSRQLEQPSQLSSTTLLLRESHPRNRTVKVRIRSHLATRHHRQPRPSIALPRAHSLETGIAHRKHLPVKWQLRIRQRPAHQRLAVTRHNPEFSSLALLHKYRRVLPHRYLAPTIRNRRNAPTSVRQRILVRALQPRNLMSLTKPHRPGQRTRHRQPLQHSTKSLTQQNSPALHQRTRTEKPAPTNRHGVSQQHNESGAERPLTLGFVSTCY